MKEDILKISLEEQQKTNTDLTPESGGLMKENCVFINLLFSTFESDIVMFIFA